MADIWLGETIIALWVLALLEKKYIIKQNVRSDGFLSYTAYFCLLHNELAVQYSFFLISLEYAATIEFIFHT